MYSAFPLFGSIRRVVLYTHLHSSATNSIEVYLPAHKLPLWRQCDRHWHTLAQLSVELRPSLFFSTLWCRWRQPRLGPTQEDQHGYIYQKLTLTLTWLPRFNMSRLMLTMTISALAAVRLACSLKVSVLSNHNPRYFRAVQSIICSLFRWRRGTEPTTGCKQRRVFS